MPAKKTAILSLGSNLGNRAAWLSQAAASIELLPDTHITSRSSIYETEPVDVPDEFKDKSFLNAVLLIETNLTPDELSDSVHRIEEQLQRKRLTPNQPRTIDIDVITFDGFISRDPSLTLPHPQSHLRRFVLQPLTEIAPDFILPEQMVPVHALLRQLPENPAVKISSEQWTY